MAPHPSTLGWRIPWTEEPGRLQFMVSLRVGHDWGTSLSLFTFMYWKRKWQPTPVFLPGESQGQRSLVGCRLWGCTELDTTEETWQQQQQYHSQDFTTRTWTFLNNRSLLTLFLKREVNKFANLSISKTLNLFKMDVIISFVYKAFLNLHVYFINNGSLNQWIRI